MRGRCEDLQRVALARDSLIRDAVDSLLSGRGVPAWRATLRRGQTLVKLGWQTMTKRGEARPSRSRNGRRAEARGEATRANRTQAVASSGGAGACASRDGTDWRAHWRAGHQFRAFPLQRGLLPRGFLNRVRKFDSCRGHPLV
jgi:hypothetical protein